MTESGLSLLAGFLEPVADRIGIFVRIRNGVTTVQAIQKALEIGCEPSQFGQQSRYDGFSPLEELTMGTRTGGVDGNAVLRLAEVFGIEGAAQGLNRESGPKRLECASDMRQLAAEARFRREHFIYWAVRHAGSMSAVMGGIDEYNVEVRTGIMQGLGFAGLRVDSSASGPRLHEISSAVYAWIVPAAKGAQIAAEALAVMR